MDVKRIGSVLTVGLLLLSVMVVVIGTVAAMRDPAMFYGRITDEKGNAASGTHVDIVLLDKYWWNATTNGDGYYEVTERYCVASTDCSEPAIVDVKQKYHMYLDGNYAGSKELIASHIDWSDFTWHPEYPCYWAYQWNRHGHEIPEFSTIAIPVASILGLLFFFNRRKRRKA